MTAPGLPVRPGKLRPPLVRPRLVVRERVYRRLDESLGVPVTLVSAPTGYGKTTAVRSWCLSRGLDPAWVMVDADDNDPVSLWTCVAMASAGHGRVRCERTLHLLSVSQGDMEAALDALAGSLADAGDPFVLILDDLHLVEDASSLDSLEYLISRLPANAHLIGLTRADPAIELARLRTRGQLSEVRAAVLGFNADEARQMLVEREGIDLSPGDVDVLLRRTEGWPAARTSLRCGCGT